MQSKKNEVSLKEILLIVKQWWAYLLSKWLVIALVGLIGGVLGVVYAILKKPVYTGTLTFVLSNDNKSSGGIASIAGQFGLDINASGSSGAFDGDNIVELLKSRRIIKGALFKKLPSGKETLINLIGDEFGFFTGWRKNEHVSKEIPFPADVTKISGVQDSLVSVMQATLVKYNLSIIKPDKKLSFYQVNATTVNEHISVCLTKSIVNEAANFYIETKTKTARANLDMLKHEADSLRSRLSGTIYASADKIDQTFNLNPALQTQRAPIQQNQVQAQVLGAAYGEVVKNLEIAKITLQKETPLYQIIDEPELPLTRVKFGRLKGLVLGGILGCFFCTVLLLFKKAWREIMK